MLLIPVELLGLQVQFDTIYVYFNNGGTWFISCLILCYLIYPLLQVTIKQISFRLQLITVLLCVAILLYSPIIVMKFNSKSIYDNPFFRIVEFTIGVILASMKKIFDNNHFFRKYLYNWPILIMVNMLMIIGVSFAVKRNVELGNYMLYNWICLPSFIIMIIGLSGIEGEIISHSRLVLYGSEIGYCFFLSQLFSNHICKIIISKYEIVNNISVIILSWLICIVIAIIFHELLEKPIKRWLSSKLLV